MSLKNCNCCCSVDVNKDGTITRTYNLYIDTDGENADGHEMYGITYADLKLYDRELRRTIKLIKRLQKNED